MAKFNDTEARTQSAFCLDLMERLNKEIQAAERFEFVWTEGFKNRTRMKEDVRRLRRELMNLQNML